MDWIGLDWIGSGLGWFVFDVIGMVLVRCGLDWIGLDCVCVCVCDCD